MIYLQIFLNLELSETGVLQCIESQKVVNQLKVHTVMVSPLRRAIETAYNVFKNHPDFDKIKFVLVPNMRESMDLAQDNPINIDELVREYREHIPHLDDSEIDKCKDRKQWFLDTLMPDLIHKVHPKIMEKKDDPCGSNLYDLIMEEQKLSHPNGFETRWNILERGQKVKKFVKNYIDEHQIPQ